MLKSWLVGFYHISMAMAMIRSRDRAGERPRRCLIIVDGERARGPWCRGLCLCRLGGGVLA